MLHKECRQAGLSLIELITVVSILGISMAVAVPGFQSVLNESRRATAVNELVASLHTARSEAITRNVQARICPSSNGTNCQAVSWKSGWILFADANGDGTAQASELLGTGRPNPRLTITTAGFATPLVYRANGRVILTPPATSGVFTVCDPGGAATARVVIISPSGQPRLSTTQVDGVSPPVCP